MELPCENGGSRAVTPMASRRPEFMADTTISPSGSIGRASPSSVSASPGMGTGSIDGNADITPAESPMAQSGINIWPGGFNVRKPNSSGMRVTQDLSDRAANPEPRDGELNQPAPAQLEVDSVRPSETIIPDDENITKSTPRVLNPLPGWLPTHADLVVKKRSVLVSTSGAAGSLGTEYLIRPNALSAGPVEYTTRTNTFSGVDFNTRASNAVGAADGLRGGVRFQLPDVRPPSGHNAGILAARRRITMRQSLAQRLRPSESADVGNLIQGRLTSTQPLHLSGDALAPAGSIPMSHQNGSGLDPDNQLTSCTSVTHSSVTGESHHTSNGGDAGGVVSAGQLPLLRHWLLPWRRRLLQGMNHIYFYWLLVFLTFFIIFEDDFKKICLPPTVDMPLEIIITVIFVLFSLEMAFSSLLRPGYFLGFYFWLDAIGTCSLVFEVPTVRIKFFGGSQYIKLSDSSSFISNAGNQLYISSKAGRVARIFRLMRMLRLYSMYTQYIRRRRIKQVLQAAGATEVDINEEQLSIIEFEMQQEMDRRTKVGQKLEELTTRRIIVGLLIIILLLPSFDMRLGTFGRSKTVGEGGLRMLHDMAVEEGQNTSSFATALRCFKEQLIFGAGSRYTGFLFSLKIANVTHMVKPKARRRFEELYFMSYTTFLCSPPPGSPGQSGNSTYWPSPSTGAGVGNCDRLDTFAVYDWRWYSQVSAVLNIARSLFIIVLLVMGAFFLNRDSRNLVLMPIERMLQRVQEMAENPLALAESRLQLQAPWQEKLLKLADPNPRSGAPSNSARESILMGQGSGRNSGKESEVSPTPMPMSGGAVDSATSGAAARSSGAAPGSSEIAASTSAPSAAGSSKIALYRTMDPGSSRLARLSTAAGAMDGSGTLAGALTRSSYRFSTAEPAQQISPLQSRLIAQWVRFRDRSHHLVRHMWDYLWEGPAGQDEDQHTPAGTGTTAGGGAGAYETEVLENSIAKIGTLLAIGFGDAGAEVIAENIRNDGDINPMVPGRKTVAIFGFCDIRHFTDTTEVLQEEVMEFVNSIAHIVHTSVSTHGGAPNKNIGDAFLLVWKFPKSVQLRDISSVARDKRDGVQRVSQGSESKKSSDRVHSIGGLGSSSAITATAASSSSITAGAVAGGATSSIFSPNTPTPGSVNASHSGGSIIIPSGITSSIAASAVAMGPMMAVASPKASFSALALSNVGAASPKRRIFSLGSNRVVPLASSTEAQSGAANALSLVKGGSLARVNLAQLTDDSFGLVNQEGQPPANKLTVIKALMSLKHDVDLSWEAKREVINAIADNALASFVLIQLALRRSARLKKYSMRKDLNRRMPGFQIAMGFGLHVGWAIEGAIGSEYKIDASYLSPNVNMAARLEAATKQFGVPLLLSEDFVECLSNDVRSKVRQIDCVTVKGSTQPMGLFTYDIDLEVVPEPSTEEVEAGDDSPVEELMWRSYLCSNEWQENPDLIDSWGVDEDFKEDFDRGFHAYRTGNWPEAQRWLEITRTARRDDAGTTRVDGPSDVLLRYMAGYHYTAPPGWRGYRELTEK
ncbi:hypothetical protein Vafri_7149 [Volvox africanus]|uniref:Guanylate cyclase domain-containing protein n=1 Tax=Volvox africanus TaxID=51714 RepID=A0A8J4B3U1_9CHLO|nr:hypothetical protein Vafri_7149 [Volvox africanus]